MMWITRKQVQQHCLQFRSLLLYLLSLHLTPHIIVFVLCFFIHFCCEELKKKMIQLGFFYIYLICCLC